mmetsp:Transcript_18525/g.71524  ORF Transcript_18525/g.71524 Transcript_18525/m.71524 type:complete len:224 (+) Transcript_18525:2476-3147(+)
MWEGVALRVFRERPFGVSDSSSWPCALCLRECLCFFALSSSFFFLASWLLASFLRFLCWSREALRFDAAASGPMGCNEAFLWLIFGETSTTFSSEEESPAMRRSAAGGGRLCDEPPSRLRCLVACFATAEAMESRIGFSALPCARERRITTGLSVLCFSMSVTTCLRRSDVPTREMLPLFVVAVSLGSFELVCDLSTRLMSSSASSSRPFSAMRWKLTNSVSR